MSKKKESDYESVEEEIDIDSLKKNKYKENYLKKIQKQIEEEDEEYENSSKRKSSYRRSRDRDEETEEKIVKIKEFDMNSLPPRNVSDKSGVKIVVIGKPGCFAPGTKVLMYNGTIKNVENIKIGDVIMGDDNTPRNVLELYNDIEEMFDIVPIKGEIYTVNKKHDLVLVCSGYNEIKKGTKIIISVEEYLNKSITWKKNFKLIRSSGVEWPEIELIIDSYMLGLWLGDGTSAEPEITNIDNEVLEYCKEYALENNMLFNKKGEKPTYRFCTDKDKTDKNNLLKGLREYKLINDKHIPFEFKINSRENRLKLLAGILDTDGYLDNKGYDLILKSEKLLDDVIFVARSLGFSAYKKQVYKSCMYKGEKRVGTYYRCFIYGKGVEEIPCKILRKKLETNDTMNKNNLVTGFKVVSKGEGEYFGFSLDKNRLFLLSSFDIVKNTGKSTIISDIIASKSHIIPVAQVFSGTEDGNHYYSEKFPKVCVYNKLDIDALHNFKKRQLIAKKYLPNPWAIQILDDCTEDRKIFNQPIIQEYYKNGRHWAMLHILSLQYAMDIPPAIRTNVDYAFILREPNLKNRKNLYENYAGSCINSFDEFEQIMDTITEDYTALVIKNMNSSNKLEDNIFWYKAKPGNIPPNWKFGHPTCWDFNNERYDPKSEDLFG